VGTSATAPTPIEAMRRAAAALRERIANLQDDLAGAEETIEMIEGEQS
jgi:hypothetical protein